MQEILLEATIRKDYGKKVGKLRRSGSVPGVYYLHGEDNIVVTVPARDLEQLVFSAETHIINLKLDDGSTRNCIIRDVQFDPVTDKPVHFDLQGLRADEKLTLEVPVSLTGGIPVGVREGGVLQHIMHRLKISCLPKDIPEHVDINVEQLKINASVHVRDLSIPNVTMLDNLDNTIVAVLPPTVEKVAVPGVVATEEISEPEVISKGKKEEDEEAAESGKKEKHT